MNFNSMNQQLFHLYSSDTMNQFRKTIGTYNLQENEGSELTFSVQNETISTSHAKGYELTHMYLLNASEDYFYSRRKIMFVGKETFGWGDQLDGFKNNLYSSDDGIDELMNLYSKAMNRSLSGPFHKYCQFITKNMEDIGIIKNNIAKIGYVYGKKGFDPKINNCKFMKQLFVDELYILKPQLIIFMTGAGANNLDHYIQDRLNAKCIKDNDPKVMAHGRSRFAWFQAKEEEKSVLQDLNCLAVRIDHPHYLSRNNKEIWKKTIDDKLLQLISDIPIKEC